MVDFFFYFDYWLAKMRESMLDKVLKIVLVFFW